MWLPWRKHASLKGANASLPRKASPGENFWERREIEVERVEGRGRQIEREPRIKPRDEKG